MTPTEREAYRKLQDEMKRCKNLGEINLIIRNGKIIQHIPRKFQARVLVNNQSTATENRDTPAHAKTGLDNLDVDQNDTSMDQDKSTTS